MKKKDYKTPTTWVVQLKQQPQLLGGSPNGDLGDPKTANEQTWE